MRVQDISLHDDRILKQYQLTSFQRDSVIRYFDEYAQWVRDSGFRTPDTKFVVSDGLLEFDQAYIEGRPPKESDWIRVLEAILAQSDNMTHGLDANPLNFIFRGGDIYFIDFYPLLIRGDEDFLVSQFPYDQSIILSRYFNKWSVIVCFLNRLRKVDVYTFKVCLEYTRHGIADHLSEIPGRDTLRLVNALSRSDEEYGVYYAVSSSQERRLTQSEIGRIAKRLHHDPFSV